MLYEQPNYARDVGLQYEQLLNAVNSEDIIHQRRIGRGITHPHWVEFEGGLTAVFKPNDVTFDNRSNPYKAVRAAKNELFWAELDREILHWNIVPAAVRGALDVEIKRGEDVDWGIFDELCYDGECSIPIINEWWENFVTEADEFPKSYEYEDAWFDDQFWEGFEPTYEYKKGTFHYRINLPDLDEIWWDEVMDTPGWMQMNILDIVFGQADRHEGNYLFNPDNQEFWAIDHGRSMDNWRRKEEEMKGYLEFDPDPEGMRYQHQVTHAVHYIEDLRDKWSYIEMLMAKYDYEWAIANATEALDTLHKILLALHEIAIQKPDKPGLITVLMGDYRFDESPREIERWLSQGWDDHPDCKCYKCLLIKEYHERN